MNTNETKSFSSVPEVSQLSDEDFITLFSEHLGSYFNCVVGKDCTICNEQSRRFDLLSDEEKRLEVDPMGGDTMSDYI